MNQRQLARQLNLLPVAEIFGISLSGVHEDCSSDQLSLFDQMKDNARSEKDKRIDQAMDKIRNKHGSETITFAAITKQEKNSK
jgi:hypothetical protein